MVSRVPLGMDISGATGQLAPFATGDRAVGPDGLPLPGTVGETGPSGTGPTGDPGGLGETGGSTGDLGPTGPTGGGGLTGANGETGPEGPDGVSGDTSFTGNVGSTGPTGTGIAGPLGATGPAGNLVFDGTRVHRTANQSAAHNFQVAVRFQTLQAVEDYDDANWHSLSTNDTQVRPTQTGRYRITGGISWGANATGYRWCSLTVSIGRVFRVIQNAAASGPTNQTIDIILDLVPAPTTQISLEMLQSSGGILGITEAFLVVQRIK